MNIKLRESKKMIVNVVYFEKSSLYKVYFADWQRTGNTFTDKSGNVKNELQQVIKFIFVNPENLGSDFAKKSPAEICQELKGKSVMITTSISS